MASVHKRPRSPYWHASFLGPDGPGRGHENGSVVLEPPFPPPPTHKELSITKRESADAQFLIKLKREKPKLHHAVSEGELTLGAARREYNTEKIKHDLDIVAAITPPEPFGKFDVIVLDPPWRVNRIALDCNPNETRLLPYPTMTLEQIEQLDLCWQFRARAADVIRAHQWSTFAGIRNLPSLICGGKEISWWGAKSRRALKMYDKNLRARGEADGVLRVELRLAGPKLREKIDVSVGLNFGELYQIFRTEVVKLAPVTLPEPRKHSFADLAAGLPLEIRSQFLLGYRQGKTSRAVRGFERKIGSACLRRIGWNWSEKLPVGHPPELINVESKRRQTQGHFPCPLAVWHSGGFPIATTVNAR